MASGGSTDHRHPHGFSGNMAPGSNIDHDICLVLGGDTGQTLTGPLVAAGLWNPTWPSTAAQTMDSLHWQHSSTDINMASDGKTDHEHLHGLWR